MRGASTWTCSIRRIRSRPGMANPSVTMRATRWWSIRSDSIPRLLSTITARGIIEPWDRAREHDGAACHRALLAHDIGDGNCAAFVERYRAAGIIGEHDVVRGYRDSRRVGSCRLRIGIGRERIAAQFAIPE